MQISMRGHSGYDFGKESYGINRSFLSGRLDFLDRKLFPHSSGLRILVISDFPLR